MIPPSFLVSFGFKSSKPFNLNCQSANLIDHIVTVLSSDSRAFLCELRAKWTAKIEQLASKSDQLTKSIAALNEPEKAEDSDKAKKAAAVTKKKDESKAVETKRLKEEQERVSKEMALYQEKIVLIGEEEKRLEGFFSEAGKLGNFDLVDATGERKFLGKRLEQRASDFVSGNKVFFLVRVENRDDSNSDFKPLVFDPSYCLSVEELAGAKQEFSIVEVIKARTKKRK